MEVHGQQEGTEQSLLRSDWGTVAMEGSVALRLDARTRGGYQAITHLLGLGPGRSGSRKYRNEQGRFEAPVAVGVGEADESPGPQNSGDALKLSLMSCWLDLCSQSDVRLDPYPTEFIRVCINVILTIAW